MGNVIVPEVEAVTKDGKERSWVKLAESDLEAYSLDRRIIALAR